MHKNSFLDCSSRDMHTMSVDFLNLMQALVKYCNMIINGFVSKAWGYKITSQAYRFKLLGLKKPGLGQITYLTRK